MTMYMDQFFTGVSINRPTAQKAEKTELSPRGEAVQIVKKVLSHSLYEDSDYVVADKYIQIDLCYDCKSRVTYLQGLLEKKFPGKVKTEGSITTVYYA